MSAVTNDTFYNVDDPEAVAAQARHVEEQTRLEEELTRRAERLDKLCTRLEKLAEITLENSTKGEYASAQERLKEIKAEIEALTPTALVPWQGVSDTLDQIVRELHRFLVMSERDAQIIALWIVHTHVFLREIFDHTPHLIVWSETHGCGKTTLRQIISRLAANVEAVDSVNGSEFIAFLRRLAAIKNDPLIFEQYNELGLLGPGIRTYLMDEAERYDFTGLLIRLINAAHGRDGSAWGRDGSHVPIFAPMAMFRRHDPRYILDLAPTVSRAILIEMKVRDPDNPDHKREEFRSRNRFVRRLALLRQQISTLVQGMKEDFEKWLPEEGFLKGNRVADNWEPLCAIADLAGGHWGKTAREIAKSQQFDPNDFVMRTRHAPDMSKVKSRIMAHLMSLATHRCSRTELHEEVFSNNIPAAALQAAIQELQDERKITTQTVPPGNKGGRRTMMLELVVPVDRGDPPDDGSEPKNDGNATLAIQEGASATRAARATGS
jgi:hypothetical protein